MLHGSGLLGAHREGLVALARVLHPGAEFCNSSEHISRLAAHPLRRRPKMRVLKTLRLQALDDVLIAEDTAILTLRNDVDVQGELLLHLPLRLTDSVADVFFRCLPDLNEPLIAGWRILRRPGIDPQARRGL